MVLCGCVCGAQKLESILGAVRVSTLTLRIGGVVPKSVPQKGTISSPVNCGPYSWPHSRSRSNFWARFCDQVELKTTSSAQLSSAQLSSAQLSSVRSVERGSSISNRKGCSYLWEPRAQTLLSWIARSSTLDGPAVWSAMDFLLNG